MTFYADNPRLKLTTVTTVRGDTEYRRNCKHIGGKYYVMERDCFCINGKWYRYDGGNIIFDSERGLWIHKSEGSRLVRGIVGIENGSPVLGYFTPNPYNNVQVYTNKYGLQTGLNSDFLEDQGFFEDPAYSTWYCKKELSSADLKKRQAIRNGRGFTDRGYNIEENEDDFEKKVENFKNYDLPISTKAKTFAKYLGENTFGAEIEISEGNYPSDLQNRYGVVICRDGSIDGGPELVTIPMSGAKGIQALSNIGDTLYTRGNISLACSFHVHIGNVPTDKLFLTAFWLLCRKIQDELFTMFPGYKTNPSGVKKKNYNQKLNRIGIYTLQDTSKEAYQAYLVDCYAKMFNFLSEGRMSLDQFDRRTREHPIARKWDRKNRYFWSNLMNMFFTHRNTLEFRLHTPTTNPTKMINWLFICVAIVRYAERHAKTIITSDDQISVKQVLNVFRELYPRDKNAKLLGEYLYAYFKERQKSFAKDMEKGDKVSEWDMIQDKDYTFEYEGLTGLVD